MRVWVGVAVGVAVGVGVGVGVAGDVARPLVAGATGLAQGGVDVWRLAGMRTLTGAGAGPRSVAGTWAGTWTRAGHGAAGQRAGASTWGHVHPGRVQDVFELLPVGKTQQD